MNKVIFWIGLPLILFGTVKIASAATLSLSPSTNSYTSGQVFTVDINLDTQGAAIDGVDLYFLRYNSAILEVQDSNSSVSGTQITPGSLLSQTLTNTVDAASGKVTFSQVTTGGTTYNGSGKLASISFKALANGTSSVAFDFTPGSTADTNVAGAGVDKLTGVTNGSYTVTGSVTTAPTATISVSPSSITSGGTATLTWSTTNATSVSINQGIGSVTGSGSRSVNPAVTTTYTITATGTSGTTNASTTLTVGAPTNTLPVGNFDEIRLSDGAVRGWSYDPDSSSSSEVVQIFINGAAGAGTLISSAATDVLRSDVNTARGITGNHGFEFLIPNTYRDGISHSIYVYGIDINDSTRSTLLAGSPKSFTLTTPISPTPTPTPTPPPATGVLPTINFTATPSTISAGGTAVLDWSVTLASTVSIDQGIGTVLLNSGQSVSPSVTTTYTLTAINNDGTSTKSVTVTVSGDGVNPTPPPPADQTNIPSDGTLVKSSTSPAIYIMEYGKKRPFATWDAFIGSGFKTTQIRVVDTSAIPMGDGIFTKDQRHTRGVVVLIDGTVYYSGALLKYAFPSEAVFTSWGHTFAEVVAGNSYDRSLSTGPLVELKTN